jgi:hypothetical protein
LPAASRASTISRCRWLAAAAGPQFLGQFRPGAAVEALLLAPPVLFGVRRHEQDVTAAAGRLAKDLLPDEIVGGGPHAFLGVVHVARRQTLVDPAHPFRDGLVVVGLTQRGTDVTVETGLQSGDDRVGARVLGDVLPLAVAHLGDRLLHVVEDLVQLTAQPFGLVLGQGDAIGPGTQGPLRLGRVTGHVLGGLCPGRPRVAEGALAVAPEFHEDLVRNPQPVLQREERIQQVASGLFGVPVQVQQHVGVGGDQSACQYGGEVLRRGSPKGSEVVEKPSTVRALGHVARSAHPCLQPTHPWRP